MVLEVITENLDSQVPSQEDLVGWRDEYGMTMPVMADEDGTMWSYAEGMSSVGLPFTVVVDHGLVIESIASGSQSSHAVELL